MDTFRERFAVSKGDVAVGALGSALFGGLGSALLWMALLTPKRIGVEEAAAKVVAGHNQDDHYSVDGVWHCDDAYGWNDGSVVPIHASHETFLAEFHGPCVNVSGTPWGVLEEPAAWMKDERIAGDAKVRFVLADPSLGGLFFGAALFFVFAAGSMFAGVRKLFPSRQKPATAARSGAILPPPPFAIDAVEAATGTSSVAVKVFGLLGAVFAACVLYLEHDFRRLRARWERAVPTPIVDLVGHHCNSSKCEAYAVYADDRGVRHRGRLDFAFDPWARYKQEPPPTLRYDRDAPKMFLLSWSVAERNSAEWILGALALGTLAGALWSRRKAAAVDRALVRASEDGQERLAELLTMRERLRGSFYEVRYRIDGLDRQETLEYAGKPLVIERDDKQFLLVVVSPRAPDRPVVIGEGLQPFAFDAATKREILRRSGRRVEIP